MKTCTIYNVVYIGSSDVMKITFLSSPELTVQVNFSDHLCPSSVCLFVHLFLFIFSTSSPEPQGLFQLNLAQIILGWLKEFKFVILIKGQQLFSRGDNLKLLTSLHFFKNLVSKTNLARNLFERILKKCRFKFDKVVPQWGITFNIKQNLLKDLRRKNLNVVIHYISYMQASIKQYFDIVK